MRVSSQMLTSLPNKTENALCFRHGQHLLWEHHKESFFKIVYHTFKIKIIVTLYSLYYKQ
jgi:hypothetical protein